MKTLRYSEHKNNRSTKVLFYFSIEYFLLTSQPKQMVNSDKLHFGC